MGQRAISQMESSINLIKEVGTAIAAPHQTGLNQSTRDSPAGMGIVVANNSHPVCGESVPLHVVPTSNSDRCHCS